MINSYFFSQRQRKIYRLSFVFVLLLSGNVSSWSQDLKLWYEAPARNWNEALPIGNGRVGAMVSGTIDQERLQLNEQTLWSGGPVNTNPNPQAIGYLPQVREALRKEDYASAEKLAQKMHGLFTESYEPLGDVILNFKTTDGATNYYRDLDISNATAVTKFAVNGVEYRREYLISAVDQVMVVNLTAS